MEVSQDSRVWRLLIVDDNVALARVTQFAFDKAGYSTAVAANGAAALALAQQERFDLIVTDQQMPLMTGMELCRALRDLPEYVDVPIMMLTAKGLELELEKLKEELAIEALFPKPFSPSAVVEKAHQLLGTSV